MVINKVIGYGSKIKLVSGLDAGANAGKLKNQLIDLGDVFLIDVTGSVTDPENISDMVFKISSPFGETFSCSWYNLTNETAEKIQFAWLTNTYEDSETKKEY